MKKIYKLLVFSILFSSSIAAQRTNIFHSRDFWKTNPSIQIIDKKIVEGNDIAALNKNAFDAVCYALLEKVAPKTIQYLVSKQGNGVNKLTHDGRTYIFWAAYRDNLEMMRFFLENGANMNIVDSHGYSLLNYAAKTGQLNPKLYNFCIENGSDPVKEKNHDGANALLLIAPFVKDISLINYFTSKGIDMKTTDNNGNGLFNYAAKAGNIQLMEYLLKQGLPYKKLTKKGENAMIFASRGMRNNANTLSSFKYLERLGISPNVITKKGITPLHAISYRGKDLNIYDYFLSKGVDVNQKDDNGNTPFLNAAHMNDLSIVKLLSRQVIDINLKNNMGHSALANAVNKNSVNVINYLLEKKANIHTIDKDGNTLSYYLINNFDENKSDAFETKLKILEKNGLVFNQLQNSGNTLLHIATKKNNLPLLKRLASFKIDVNTINKEGLSALQIAVLGAKDVKIMKYLMQIGADKNIKTDFDESIFDLASENELLKKYNINFLK